MAQQVYGVSALIRRRKDGYVLAISRRDDPLDLGLPGGKIEPGETPTAAAMRELWEETGVSAHAVAPVFDAMCGRHRAMTFLVLQWAGEPRSSEEGVVYWVPTLWLIDELSPTFRDYNRQLLKTLKIPIAGGDRAGRDLKRYALPVRP